MSASVLDVLDNGEILHHEGGGTLEQAVQMSCGCAIPGSVQCQAGQGCEKSGLVESVPVRGRAGRTR